MLAWGDGVLVLFPRPTDKELKGMFRSAGLPAFFLALQFSRADCALFKCDRPNPQPALAGVSPIPQRVQNPRESFNLAIGDSMNSLLH